MLSYISSARVDGLTGPISFAESKRQNFKLDLLKLKREKMEKVGVWTPKKGLKITDSYAFLQGKESRTLQFSSVNTVRGFFTPSGRLYKGHLPPMG